MLLGFEILQQRFELDSSAGIFLFLLASDVPAVQEQLLRLHRLQLADPVEQETGETAAHRGCSEGEEEGEQLAESLPARVTAHFRSQRREDLVQARLVTLTSELRPDSWVGKNLSYVAKNDEHFLLCKNGRNSLSNLFGW